MAAGCCAIASRVGGNPELVRDGETGLLFEPGDAASLAERLRAVIHSDDLRLTLADSGARFVAANFRTARSVVRMQEIYAGFLDGVSAVR
jgi:glycosyltransferase involved in cell wall biosynthesis